MATEEKIVRVLDITEEVTVCDCCGKSNLKCTVIIEIDGEVFHYGRDCAASAVYGGKSRKNAELVEKRARAMHKIAPVLEAIRNALPDVSNALAAGKVAAKGIWINGGDVLVSGGFASWGFIRVDWNGGTERVIFDQATVDKIDQEDKKRWR